MKIIQALIATAVYIGLLFIVYYVHINWFKVNVVLYAAIQDGIVATIIAGLILVLLKYFDRINSFEKIQLIMIWLITSYAIAISVPTVIDRSLSFYILEKIQQRGGGIKKECLEKVFTQEYLNEHHLVDIRLTEQLESKTIVIKDGCVLLTDKGQRIASFGRYFRTHWLPKHRLLMGIYSDVLTDPFRNSSSRVNCESIDHKISKDKK